SQSRVLHKNLTDDEDEARYVYFVHFFSFFFSSRRRHTSSYGDWSSDVCSSDLTGPSRCRPRQLHRGRHRLGPVHLRVGAPVDGEIGRASCRERGWRWGGGGRSVGRGGVLVGGVDM